MRIRAYGLIGVGSGRGLDRRNGTLVKVWSGSKMWFVFEFFFLLLRGLKRKNVPLVATSLWTSLPVTSSTLFFISSFFPRAPPIGLRSLYKALRQGLSIDWTQPASSCFLVPLRSSIPRAVENLVQNFISSSRSFSARIMSSI